MLRKDLLLPFKNRVGLIVILLISSYTFLSLSAPLILKMITSLFIFIIAYKPECSSEVSNCKQSDSILQVLNNCIKEKVRAVIKNRVKNPQTNSVSFLKVLLKAATYIHC